MLAWSSSAPATRCSCGGWGTSGGACGHLLGLLPLELDRKALKL
jgi:hypothetical protein